MEIESTRVFVKVVQQGSFSRAAQILKIPVSKVSRIVSRLESEIATKLLLRTTRSLKLTPAGRTFFESCSTPVQLIEDARRSLYGIDSMISGTVMVTAPEDLGEYAVTPLIAAMIQEYPNLNFGFSYTDRIVDLINEGFDFAIRVGRLKSSRMRAKKLGDIKTVLVASPAYLAKKSKIVHPKDLEHGHNLMTLSIDAEESPLTLTSKRGNITVNALPRVRGNQMGSLLSLATLGAGIAIAPHFVCKSGLEKKGLVQVLPDWSLEDHPVYLVMPGSIEPPARVRIAANRLADALNMILRDI